MPHDESKNLSIDDAFALARKYHQTERYYECVDVCGRILFVRPHLGGVYALASLAAEKLSRHPDSDRLANNAVNSYINKSRDRRNENDAKSALKLLEQALVLHPSNEVAIFEYAHSILGSGRMVDAIPLFERALYLSSESIQCLEALSDLYAVHGLWKECLDATSRIIEKEHEQGGKYLYLRAHAHYSYRDMDKALADLTKAVALSPDNSAYYVLQGHIELESGDTKKAHTAYCRSQILWDERHEAHWGVSYSAKLLGVSRNIEYGTTFFERSIATAETAESQGRRADAAQAYIRAFSARPDRDDVYRRLDRMLSDWRRDLLSEDRSVSERNPEWVQMESFLAEAKYKHVVYNNDEWSGLPVKNVVKRRDAKIFDGFMFSHEIDLLETRIKHLRNLVDYFVIVESPWNHQGQPKELTFEKNKARFSAYQDQIIHVVVEEMPRGLPWEREAFQRDCIGIGLDRVGAKDDDLLILGDVDEFPRVEVIETIKNDKSLSSRLVGLSIGIYAFFVNYKLVSPFVRPVTVPVGLGREIGFSLCRFLLVRTYPFPIPIINEAGWHFTWLGGVDVIWEKMKNFCHVETLDKAMTRDVLEEKVRRGDFNFMKMNANGRIVQIDKRFPEVMADDIARLVELGWLWRPAG
jgi:tetratricopeptide (TPR) repeat protein